MQNGPGENSQNIPFHFSVRFDDPYTGTVVVRNNKRGTTWGNEDREMPQNPFQRGSPFDLLILIEQGEFKVRF